MRRVAQLQCLTGDIGSQIAEKPACLAAYRAQFDADAVLFPLLEPGDGFPEQVGVQTAAQPPVCLLYTSDAADD